MAENEKYFPVVILGRNRTLMTIEIMRSIMRHLKNFKPHFIIGSDRSGNGHIEALSWFALNAGVKCEIFYASEQRHGLGAIANEGMRRAFLQGDVALVLENDFILRQDFDPSKYIFMLENTNVGNINLRYFDSILHNCRLASLPCAGGTYLQPMPNDVEKSFTVQFGVNVFSKKYVEAIGQLPENVDATDELEKHYRIIYNSKLARKEVGISVFDAKWFHGAIGDEGELFTHIGLTSQHSTARWNKDLVPAEYWWLSDDGIDRKFRESFVNKGAPAIDMRPAGDSVDSLKQLLERTCRTGLTMLEIGVYRGQSTEIFMETGRVAKTYCVDPWKKFYDDADGASFTDMDEVQADFDRRILAKFPGRAVKHVGTIDTFVNTQHDAIDVVYIDGLHTYEGAKHDIEMCREYIKPRVAYAGHDYVDGWSGVKKAVDEAFGKPDAVFKDGSWLKFSGNVK